MGGGSSQPYSQTTTSTPPPQAQELMGMAMPFYQQMAANPPKLPDFPMTAGFTGPQTTGQNMALTAGGPGGPQAGIVGSAAGGEGFMTSGKVLSPSSNPALQDWINSAIKPIQQTYSEDVIPQIRQSAAATGQEGSSEQGIAEGIAGRGEQQAVGATTSNIANQGYLSGLNAMLQGLSISPSIASAQTIPAATTSAVGDVQQSQEQAQINEAIQKYMFPQMVPGLMAGELMGGAGAVPGGTTSTTGTMPGTSLAQMLMGGGTVAAGLLGKGGIPGLFPA